MHLGQELIGIGIDSVAWSRMERFLNRHPPEWVERLLSPTEQNFFRVASQKLQFFARSFAAKEAFFKASGGFWLGTEAGFREIEIRMEEGPRFHVACDFRVEGKFFHTPNGIGARVLVWNNRRHYEAQRAEAIHEPRLFRRPRGSPQ